MKTIKFRDLRADEIELRVGATNETGFSLLLYKTARVDANILDETETVGAFNWQKRFYQVKQTMICEIGIYNEERKEWVWKGDAGDESNTEAIKGEASDSFKRAGFAWGIGRALYSSPFIWINKSADNDPKKSHYYVSEIEYSNGEITKLVICNEKTKQVVFSCGSSYKVSKNTDYAPKNTNSKPNNVMEDALKGIGDTFVASDDLISNETKEKIQGVVGKLAADRYAKFKVYMKDNFGVESIGELTETQGQQLLKALGGK